MPTRCASPGTRPAYPCPSRSSRAPEPQQGPSEWPRSMTPMRYSIEEFCRRHRLSLQMFYKRPDLMPDTFNVGKRRLISREAARALARASVRRQPPPSRPKRKRPRSRGRPGALLCWPRPLAMNGGNHVSNSTRSPPAQERQQQAMAGASAISPPISSTDWPTSTAAEGLRREQLRQIPELRSHVYRHAKARGLTPTMLRATRGLHAEITAKSRGATDSAALVGTERAGSIKRRCR